MNQKIITPPILNCARCGATAKALSWNFDFNYKVYCDNNHTSPKECASRHRAICRWNNKQIKMSDEMNKTLNRYYRDFQALAFASTPRKEWPLRLKIYLRYLALVIWLHQGIFHKNWS